MAVAVWMCLTTSNQIKSNQRTLSAISLSFINSLNSHRSALFYSILFYFYYSSHNIFSLLFFFCRKEYLISIKVSSHLFNTDTECPWNGIFFKFSLGENYFCKRRQLPFECKAVSQIGGWKSPIKLKMAAIVLLNGVLFSGFIWIYFYSGIQLWIL